MYKHLVITRTITCCVGLIFFLSGCGSQPESPSAKMVTQKIVADKTKTPPPPAPQTTAPQPTEAKQPALKRAPAVEEAGKDKTDALETVEVYNPEGKIDPFVPLFKEEPVAAAGQKGKKTSRAPLTPLEKIDLSQLKLAGIIRSPTGNKALVEEATGKGYIVKKGTFIGIRSGKVLEILKDRIIVEEEVDNFLGGVTIQKRELILQKLPGEE